METWKEIPNWEKFYLASSDGKIKSIRKNKELIGLKSPSGYVRVDLQVNNYRKSILIHRLVALAFIPNPGNKFQVNHKNGIKYDNRIDNLEWATPSENQKHSFNILKRASPIGCTGKSGILSKKARKIAQIDINTNKVVGIYYGENDASYKTKINRGNIGMALRNKRLTAGGYKWSILNKNK